MPISDQIAELKDSIASSIGDCLKPVVRQVDPIIGPQNATERQQRNAKRKLKNAARSAAQAQKKRVSKTIYDSSECISLASDDLVKSVMSEGRAKFDNGTLIKSIHELWTKLKISSCFPLARTRACVQLPKYTVVKDRNLNVMRSVDAAGAAIDKKYKWVFSNLSIFHTGPFGGGINWCGCSECVRFVTHWDLVRDPKLWFLVTLRHTPACFERAVVLGQAQEQLYVAEDPVDRRNRQAIQAIQSERDRRDRDLQSRREALRREALRRGFNDVYEYEDYLAMNPDAYSATLHGQENSEHYEY